MRGCEREVPSAGFRPALPRRRSHVPVLPDDLGPRDGGDYSASEKTRTAVRGPTRRRPAPTPDERVVFELGQLYKLHRAERRSSGPEDFIFGPRRHQRRVRNDDIEFLSEDRRGAHRHLADEVLHINNAGARDFPGGY